MDKIIFIGLVIVVIILIINLYEASKIIQILLNKVSSLNRELVVLKNKEKTQKCKEEIDEIGIENGYTYLFSEDELYLKLKNTETEKGNRYT